MHALSTSTIRLCLSWLSALLCTLVLGSVSACSTDDIVDEVHYEGNAEGRYVRLNISVSVGEGSRATRATTYPNGGENGNGSEVGTADENAVEKVTIFLFKQTTNAVKGINDADAASLYVHAYCWGVTPTTSNADGEPVYTTGAQPLTTTLEYGTYQVLAVANADLTALDGATLKTVREQLYDHSPYTTKVSTTGLATTDFVMASAADATITISESAITQSNGVVEDGSQAKPFSAEIDVERLAARIDFDTEAATKLSRSKLLTALNGEKEETDKSYVTLPSYVETAYQYNVTDDNGTANGDVLYLTAVTPFNTTEQARLFKYVGEPDAANKATITSYAYLADETPNNDQTTGNVQQNYVVDPYFSDKTAASTTDFSAFYTAALRRALLDSDDDVLEETIAKYPVKDVSSSSNTYYTVSYTTENTFPTTVQGDDDLMSAYATGLRFDGYYKFSTERTDDRAGLVFPVHYYYYLRHSDPTGKADATAVMRNGVVRNNIYRVSISHVNEVTNFNLLKIIIKVVPWQDYEHEEIVM